MLECRPRRKPTAVTTLALILLPVWTRAQTPAPSPPALGSPAPEASAEVPALLPESVVRALAQELSGTAAKHTVQELTLHHRMRGSKGFRAAVEAIVRGAKEAGLDRVEII